MTLPTATACALEITERLILGFPSQDFADAEIDLIESWGIDEFTGTICNSEIKMHYFDDPENEHTWRELAAVMRATKRSLSVMNTSLAGEAMRAESIRAAALGILL